MTIQVRERKFLSGKMLWQLRRIVTSVFPLNKSNNLTEKLGGHQVYFCKYLPKSLRMIRFDSFSMFLTY